MSLHSRLSKLETALQPAARGVRNFVSAGDGLYVENTAWAERGGFDYARAMWGCGGPETIPPDEPRLTDSDLARLSTAGWQIVIVEYSDMNLAPGYFPVLPERNLLP